MRNVIEIRNLSKIYRLGEISTGTISQDMERWYRMRIRGQEDPFLKIGEINESSKKGTSDVVYSLRDISLDVQQGVALGIIGRNGAGKSTLLKILSRVTNPTTGRIHIKGRVASLLEVGTGFHPELTGRENIFLNGAILGMRKKEITGKLDEIIEFSGVKRFIDTPVKRYSSGMYVRLAFAVAAHLESEIMIVDEVLAVGDAEFQKKCLGKMGDISKGEGRTVLFVSHNMAAVLSLCQNAILLDKGKIEASGAAADMVNEYIGNKSRVTNYTVTLIPLEEALVSFTKIWLADNKGNLTANVDVRHPFMLGLEFRVLHHTNDTEITVVLSNSNSVNVLFSSLSDCNDKKIVDLIPGVYQASVWIQENFLVPDMYSVRISAHYPNKLNIDTRENVFHFSIVETGSTMARYGSNAKHWSCILGGAKWQLSRT